MLNTVTESGDLFSTLMIKDNKGRTLVHHAAISPLPEVNIPHDGDD